MLFVLQFLVAISWICTYIWGIFHEFLPLVVYILPHAVINIQAPPVNFMFSTFGGVWGDGHLWYPQVRIVIYFIQSRFWYIKPQLTLISILSLVFTLLFTFLTSYYMSIIVCLFDMTNMDGASPEKGDEFFNYEI